MENVSNVWRPWLLSWSGTDSYEHCVLIVFRLDAWADAWGTVTGMGMLLVIAFNDDRLLGASSIDVFWDKATKKRFDSLTYDSHFDGKFHKLIFYFLIKITSFGSSTFGFGRWNAIFTLQWFQ